MNDTSTILCSDIQHASRRGRRCGAETPVGVNATASIAVDRTGPQDPDSRVSRSATLSLNQQSQTFLMRRVLLPDSLVVQILTSHMDYPLLLY